MLNEASCSPLIRLARGIDIMNEHIGRTVAWLVLAMVLVQFVVVLLRYTFGVGSLFLQESIVYLHATMFMLGAGYTFLHGQHVRVDVFYREASEHRKAMVDLAGVIFFLLPVCALITIYGWPYVSKSWAVLEGSKETSGIPAVFILKTAILFFAVLMALQGISLALKSYFRIRGKSMALSTENKTEKISIKQEYSD